MRILYLDCFSGISGDMCLSALLDLGVPLDLLRQVVDQLGVDITLKANKVIKSSLQATQIQADSASDQPHGRSLRSLRTILHNSNLPGALLDQVDTALMRLAEAEAEAHGAVPEEVHFHEIGGLDTLLDLAGTFAAVAYLGVKQVQISPLPLARGTIRTMHGILPLPAPATLQLIKDIPTYGVPLEAELVTPTGAVLAISLASGFGPPPLANWERFGYGAGRKDLPGQPNVLRAWLGETKPLSGFATTDGPSSDTVPTTATSRVDAGMSSCFTFDEDMVLVLETQLDDINPELLPYLRTQLEQGGAIDVLYTPTVMKKGRPGNLITILSPKERLIALTHILFRESSALGLRWYPVGRIKLFRTVDEVDTPYGPIPIKVGYAQRPDGTREDFNLAPEYEACASLAQSTKNTLKEIYQIALSSARIKLPKHPV